MGQNLSHGTHCLVEQLIGALHLLASGLDLIVKQLALSHEFSLLFVYNVPHLRSDFESVLEAEFYGDGGTAHVMDHHLLEALVAFELSLYELELVVAYLVQGNQVNTVLKVNGTGVGSLCLFHRKILRKMPRVSETI